MQSIEEAVEYFGGEELPATVWAEKYAARNLQSVRVESVPTQMHRRLAKEFARIEKGKFKKPYSEEYLFSLFDRFSSVIPQGSPMAGIGVEQLVSLSNCFVVAPPTDSYGGIMRTDEQMVQLCKRRGGVGTDLSHIRPDDLPTSNSARKATGVVPFMRRYSNTIREVGQAGRRGALMLTLSVHHPQILDFARIKMNPEEVTGANVSVRLSDEFLSAVKAGTTYEQRWPVDSPTPQIRRQVDARTVWKEIITCAHARAEPGLLFWDHVLRDNPAECYADVGFGTVSTNPCIPFRTLLLTPEGLRQVGNLDAGDVIWSQDGWVKIKAKWCTGVKDVWRYRTTTGVVYCTENHPVMQQGQQVEASQADSIDVLKGPTLAGVVHNPQTVMDGLYFGDGGGTREYSNILFIGKDDRDYFDSEVSHLILRQDQKEERHGWRVQSTLTHEDLGYTYERRIPQKFMQAHPSEAASFLRGLYTANGSVVANRVTLKTSSAGLVEDVQILLSSLGIRSYFTTNKPTEVEFRNGKYLCKQSYDINISRDRDKFLRVIGFIQKYKMEKLIKLVENLKPSNKPETTDQAIVSREYVSTEEVYDIEVEGPSHTFWLGGHSVHNCSEIPLSILDACRLLVVNLFTCVVDPFKKKASFDFLALYDLAYVAQRLMDDLVDLEIECIDRILKKIDADPEPEEVKRTERELWQAVRASVVNGRRTGLGPTALGDAIAAIGLKYGSDESVAFTEEVYKTLKLAAYRSSVDMAKELGAFPVWDADKERDCPFLLRIAEEDPKLYRDMQKYGRRNIALLTTAPVGSVSLLAKIGPYFGSCSGIEPLFNDRPYTRRKKINHAEVGARVDFVDPQGDRWTEFEVRHAGIRLWSDVSGETDWKKSPYHKCCAEDLDWKQRVKLQAAAQKHIDHAISSCLAVGSSTIWTSEGLLDIEEIAEQCGAANSPNKTFTNVEGFSSVNIAGREAAVTAVYNNGPAEVVQLSLSNGSSMTCTPNHKVVVLNSEYKEEWRAVGDLKPGEWVVGRKGLHLWGKTDKALSQVVGQPFDYERRTNSKDVTIPKRMSTALARLIGYLSSDGSVGVNGVSLCQLANNVGPDFCRLMLKLFNVDTVVVADDRSEGLYNYVCNSREISAFFTWMGLGEHNSNRVPKVIRCSGRDCVKEFIRGATLDGHVGEKNITVASAVSKPYLIQLRELLLNWGIESRVLRSSEASEKEFPCGRTYCTQEAWSLIVCDSREIEKFANEIGFAEDRKNQEMKTKWKRPSRIKVKGEIPDFGLRERFRTECLQKIRSNRIYEMFHPLTGGYCQGRDLSRESLLEMADVGFKVPSLLIDPTYTFAEVVSVKEVGVESTYDLSVPDANSYIANGLVSHNTINLPEEVSVEKVAEIYQAAWEQGCKGITVYRKNCRTGVLVDQPTAPVKKRVKTSAPKRPKELKCEVHHTSVKGQPCVVLVGLLEDEPYEAFALLGGREPIFKCKSGTLAKEKRGHYRFGCEGGEWIDVTEQLSDEQAAVTRLVSTSLRHGVDTAFVVQQLEKVKGEFNGFAKAVARTLKKYITDGTKVSGDKCDKCGSEHLVRQEGCVLCMDCGHSKCN